jgi:TatA/E family protein of Tat protein translocase
MKLDSRTGGKATMGPLGWQETVVIFLLALLIFGPRKLPELGKTIGKAITEFRRASSDLKATFDREMRSMEQETQSLREVTSSFQNELYNATSDSSYNSSSYGYGDSYPYSDSSYGSSDSSTTSTLSASATEGAESTDGSPSDANGDAACGAPEAPPETVPRSAEPPAAAEASDSRAVTT